MRIPVVPLAILFVLSVLVDLYILSDIRRYVSEKSRKAAVAVYSVLSVALWILLIVAVSLPRRGEDGPVLFIMWTLFSYLSVYFPKIIYSVCSLIGRSFTRKNKRRLTVGGKIGIFLAVLTFILMWWGVVFTRHDIQVNRVEIESAKLPASFDGFKVLHFSDMHLGTWGNDTAFVSKMVDEINALRPDLILFTGDFVNRKGSEMKPFLKILSRLKATHGVYGVYGNHDYGGYVDWKSDKDNYVNLTVMHADIEGTGMKMLLNETDFPKIGNDSIVLIGVHNWGEPPFTGLGDLGKSYPGDKDTLKGLNDGMFKILMTHNPVHWDEVATEISNIDLTLSGHTHAMQMMAKIGKYSWSPSAFRYPHWGGLYSEVAKDGTPMHLYVNIGVGEVGFPSRIGAAAPELTLITLRSK